MTKIPKMTPLDAPKKDGPFGYYQLIGKDGKGPNLKYEVRHHEPPKDEPEKDDSAAD